MLHQVIYSSRAAPGLTGADLEAILVDARTGNAARGVTGALVFVEGVFLQVLEGERDVVHALMARIAADTRHGDVTVFHETDLEQRAFGGWHMARVDATPAELAAWAGLPGTASVSQLLAELGRDTSRAAEVARGLLQALAA